MMNSLWVCRFMKNLFSLFLALIISANVGFAASYGCKVYNINNKASFKTCKKIKKTFKHSGGNMGIQRTACGQYIGTYKVKGKRIVAYDREGHRMSYCRRDSRGRLVHYDRSGRPDGFCN